jgi:hypothetical protein
MLRISFIALSTLMFAGVLVHAAESPNDLEATAIKIMDRAFCIGDYNTVEFLFDKLSLENKKKFFFAVTETALSETNEKPYQTQLLGKLAASLLETDVVGNRPPGDCVGDSRQEAVKTFSFDSNAEYRMLPTGGRQPTCQNIPDGSAKELSEQRRESERRGMYFMAYYVGDVEKINPSITHIIQTVIEPESWQSIGYSGEGTMDYHSATQSLAIRQTEGVHAQIEELLGTIRKMQDNSQTKPPKVAEQQKFMPGLEFKR